MDAVTSSTRPIAAPAASEPGTLSAEDAARLRARYPASRMRGPLGWLLIGACVVVVVAWTIWAGVHGATKKVEGQVHSFHASSDTLVSISVDVQRHDPARAATCDVTAVGTNGIAVGETTATVPAGGTRMTTLSVPVRTTERALSAKVDNCRSQ